MFENEKVGAVVTAAGSSRRMGDVDKIFSLLGSHPVLACVVDVFQNCEAIDQIVVVLNRQNIVAGRKLATEYGWSKVTDLCEGGPRRQDSVTNGLNRLNNCRWVVIHDGARPLVTVDLIEHGLEAALDTGAAIAAVPVSDTIKIAGKDMIVQGTPPRHDLWSVQTPQIFRYELISGAYRQIQSEVTDDAMAVEKSGHRVKIYTGSYDNIKITTPDDLLLAEVLWRKYGR
jgi:2-C-methyl-D-erythritol 4-phosphate cytidylyltransferase